MFKKLVRKLLQPVEDKLKERADDLCKMVHREEGLTETEETIIAFYGGFVAGTTCAQKHDDTFTKGFEIGLKLNADVARAALVLKSIEKQVDTTV
jgi:hypothetical protein